MQVTIQSFLEDATRRLEPSSETARLDAQILLAHVLGKSRSWVLAHPEDLLSGQQTVRGEDLLKRLCQGEPLPYLLGHWEFFGLDFSLTRDVLIPRPESELIVEKALSWLKFHPGSQIIADVGTGSGCIAVSLAVNLAGLRVLASDLSIAAIRVASANARRHAVSSQIDFIQADLLTPIWGSFDLVCANLPYIPSTTLKALDVYQREPELALDGGFDGLVLIQRLMEQYKQRMSRQSLLLMEIGYTQGEAALELAHRNFPQAEVDLISDLANLDRLLVVESIDEY